MWALSPIFSLFISGAPGQNGSPELFLFSFKFVWSLPSKQNLLFIIWECVFTYLAHSVTWEFGYLKLPNIILLCVFIIGWLGKFGSEFELGEYDPPPFAAASLHGGPCHCPLSPPIQLIRFAWVSPSALGRPHATEEETLLTQLLYIWAHWVTLVCPGGEGLLLLFLTASPWFLDGSKTGLSKKFD